MSTTFRLWVDDLETITISGATLLTQGPPASIQTADLPAAYITLPTGDETMLDSSTNGERTMTCDLVVLLEPVAQNTQAANFDATVTMLDSVTTALRTLESTSLLIGPMTFRSRIGIVDNAGSTYWAVITTISGKDA